MNSGMYDGDEDQGNILGGVDLDVDDMMDSSSCTDGPRRAYGS